MRLTKSAGKNQIIAFLNDLASKVERQGKIHVSGARVNRGPFGVNINVPGTNVLAGLQVYKWVEDGDYPKAYKCYLQKWVNGNWQNANTILVICKAWLEPSGNNFDSGVYFRAVGSPDEYGVVPVEPCGVWY